MTDGELPPDVHSGARYLANVRVTLRDGFFVGLSTALFCGLFLIWLWQPDRQVRRHTQKLFHQIEAKNWSAVSDLIDSEYSDQWNHDRTNLIERMREVMRYLRGMRIVTGEPAIKIDNRNALWMGKITIEGDAGEAMALIKERINSLATPFELQWRRDSGKPWDWKLVRVSNPELQLPSDFE
jgi:hypothetical protein